MNKRTIIVPKGIKFQKKTQSRSGSGWIPRYSNSPSTKKTAFRHVRHRRGEYRKGQFSFRITRDDGTVIDETTLRYYGQGINIFQKKDEYPEPAEVWHLRMVGSAHGRDEDDPDDLQYWTKTGDVWKYKDDSDIDYIVEFSYNTVTQIWTVPFYEWQTVKKNEKCFVRFICEDSITAWYKKPIGEDLEYAYKTADLFNDEDLIKPKFYEIAAPYWNITYESDKPDYVELPYYSDCDELISLIEDKPHYYSPWNNYYTSKSSFYKKVIVKSSIPYKIEEKLNSAGEHISSFGYDAEGVIGPFWGTLPCPQLSALCISYGATAVFQGTQIDVTYTSVDPPSSWDSVSESFTVAPNIAGKTFTINVDLTSVEVPYYSYCWYAGDKYEHYSDHAWYRFNGYEKEVSNFIVISASVDYD